MPIAYLADRGVVRVSGEDAKSFLDGLVTCDLDRVAPGRPRYGGLLTPQGKILFDFIVFEADDGYCLDCAKAQTADLVRRLGFYKLRAKVTVENRSDTLGVVAGWGDSPPPANAMVAADDPRLPELGWRALTSPPVSEVERTGGAPGEGASQDEALSDAPPHPVTPSARLDLSPHGGEREYHAHRIALGVPEGGKDFSFGDAFPHEALMDQLHGVDFDKGCYVGQEVVSRMQHRGTARTRIVPLVYRDGSAAVPGAEVTAGERVIGMTGSAAGGRGLAMIRLDRATEAIAGGEPIRAAGRPVRLEKPDWATFEVPSEAATPAA